MHKISRVGLYSWYIIRHFPRIVVGTIKETMLRMARLIDDIEFDFGETSSIISGPRNEKRIRCRLPVDSAVASFQHTLSLKLQRSDSPTTPLTGVVGTNRSSACSTPVHLVHVHPSGLLLQPAAVGSASVPAPAGTPVSLVQFSRPQTPLHAGPLGHHSQAAAPAPAPFAGPGAQLIQLQPRPDQHGLLLPAGLTLVPAGQSAQGGCAAVASVSAAQRYSTGALLAPYYHCPGPAGASVLAEAAGPGRPATGSVGLATGQRLLLSAAAAGFPVKPATRPLPFRPPRRRRRAVFLMPSPDGF
ncbi:unnamed protein product [Protopolystoma xenopodis]|uniref:Uncharacterized protein n=1 Tax=Protopolystoma xenopodis TaxID=117903 RepID=A0A448WNB8_9PLAT|nr:unnamed protein product [Protopolystoma xenopodis]